MRTVHSTLTRDHVQGYCLNLLHRQLRLPDHGPRVTAARVYDVLLYVAATAATIAQACRALLRALLRAPSDQCAGAGALSGRGIRTSTSQPAGSRVVPSGARRRLTRGRSRTLTRVADITGLPSHLKTGRGRHGDTSAL
jgi:hypothetical protein